MQDWIGFAAMAATFLFTGIFIIWLIGLMVIMHPIHKEDRKMSERAKRLGYRQD